MNIEEYLGTENARNKRDAELLTRIVKKAFGNDEQEIDVIVGHHITFTVNKNIQTVNEIPSADTLCFDHSIMKAIFGKDAPSVMMRLAQRPAAERDALLRSYLDHKDGLSAEEESIPRDGQGNPDVKEMEKEAERWEDDGGRV